MEDLIHFVPLPLAPSSGGDVPLAVQVSFFGCGGTAIGVCMWHRLVDAMSMVAFINAWATAYRRDAKILAVTQPSFDVTSRFSPSNFSDFFKSVQSGPPPPPEKIVMKVFTFDAEKLAVLKTAASGPLLESPTRVEAVSAFNWKHYIDSAAARNPNRVFAAIHVVDIRRRASPPLPQNFFGNTCAKVMAVATDPSLEQDYYHLARKLKEEIQKADTDYIKRFEDGDAFLKYFAQSEENDPELKEGGKTVDICCFTSWWRLPAYDADFRWEKPIWVSLIVVPAKNLIIFLCTKCGDGIEAWVSMVEEDTVIETNYNLPHPTTVHN